MIKPAFNCGYHNIGNSMVAWYPTRATEQLYGYKLALYGYVAVDAPVVAGPLPLIVFSHGTESFPQQSLFITEHLARCGWIVAAIHHRDTSIPNFIAPGTWTEGTCFYRCKGITSLLDITNNIFSVSEQVGIMGHSLGGYVALAMAGGIDSWRDDRLKFAIGLSPYNWPIYHLGGFERITVPVQLQGGPLDLGITPTLPEVLTKLGGPKELIMIDDASHFAWTGATCIGYTSSESCITMRPKAKAIVGAIEAFIDSI